MKERIIEIRKANGKTQDEFAEIMGISKNYVSLIENGKKSPSKRLISDICRKFGVNEEWLEFGRGEMKNEPDNTYTQITALIGERDEKAKQAIMDYWKLDPSDKELFWKFIEKFVKGGN